MRTSFLLFLTICIFFSCSSDDDGIQSNLPGEIELTFTENSRVQILNNPNIAPLLVEVTDGDLLVFNYSRSDGFDNSIADDEIDELIVFEVDPNSNSFSYSGQDFIDNNAYYSRSCFCLPVGAVQIQTGTISGTRISNQEWSIVINVTIDFESFTQLINVSGIYRLKQNS
ncbi:hypothetical protein GTQ40_13230 [Flavobacteriaceae bacterium R38]|nr:hypothetical protein [Flavobacteriaceae bacterium R38]